MPPVISVTTAQVTLTYNSVLFDSGGAATVLGFTSGSAWTAVTLENLCELVATAWEDNLQDQTAQAVTLTNVRAVSDATAQEVGVGLPGTIDFATTPPNTALLVNYITPSRGRRGRGRSFWPGVTFENTTNDAGIIDAGHVTALQASIDQFFDDILAGDASFQVVIQNSEGDTPPLVPPPIVTTRVVSNKVATQRRRLRR